MTSVDMAWSEVCGCIFMLKIQRCRVDHSVRIDAALIDPCLSRLSWWFCLLLPGETWKPRLKLWQVTKLQQTSILHSFHRFISCQNRPGTYLLIWDISVFVLSNMLGGNCYSYSTFHTIPGIKLSNSNVLSLFYLYARSKQQKSCRTVTDMSKRLDVQLCNIWSQYYNWYDTL